MVVTRRVFNPFKDFQSIDREIARLFDSVQGETAGMQVDVIELEESFELYADLPGVKKEDLDIQIHDGRLAIVAEKKQQGPQEEKDDQKRKYYRSEIYFGKLERSFALPKAADPEHVEASLESGVLKVSIGKKPELKPRKISLS
jgi:HSP20 family protein